MLLTIGQPRARGPLLRSLPLARHAPLTARWGRQLRGPWRGAGLSTPLVVAVSGGDGGLSSAPPPQQPSGWQTFWGAVDVGAWLGAMGAAAAFLITQEAMLAAAPVALPILALYASKQRERLATEASQAALAARSQQLLERVAQLARGAAGEAAATEIVRAVELQQQASSASAGVLKSLDAKLAAVEGSVISTGGSTREALKESTAAQGRLAQETMTRLEALATAVRRDVSAELQRTGADEMAVLSRVEARLAVRAFKSLENAIRSLESSQSDGLRRISSSVSSALMDAEDSLEAVVRAEASRSLEPLRRLPQLIAQAMPVTPEVVGGPTPISGLSEEALRELLSEQLGAAMRTILQRQAELLDDLRGTPALVAPQQWNQLGARLLGLDADVKALLAAQEALAAAAGAAPPAPAMPAADAELAAQLAALRGDVAALAASLEQLTQLAAAATERQGSSGGRAGRPVLREGSELEEAGSEDEVASSAAAAQQQQQLEEALQLLRVLSGRLDGLGQQVADAVAQQAQQAAAAPSPQQAQQAPAAAEGVPAVAPTSAAVAELEAREAAYMRMQALLNSSAAPEKAPAGGEQQGHPSAAATGEGGKIPDGAQSQQAPWADDAAAASNGGAPELAAAPSSPGDVQPQQQQRPQSPAVPIREWLSGRAPGSGGGMEGATTQQQQEQQQPDLAGTGAAVSGAGAGPAVVSGPGQGGTSSGASFSVPSWAAAPAEGQPAGTSAAGGSSPVVGGGSSPGMSPYLQSQIAYGAALGVFKEEAPGAASSPVEAGAREASPTATGESAAPTPTAPPPSADLGTAAQQQQQQQPSWAAPAAAVSAPAAGPTTGGQAAAWDGAVAAAPPSPSELPTQGVHVSKEAAPAAAPADTLWSSLLAMGADEVFQRGRQRLQEGRELTTTPGGDLGLADSLLYESELCFEAALQQEPGNVKAWGNLGNALMAHGRLKLQMLGLLRAQRAALATGAGAADVALETEERLAREARDLLVMAGRKYAKVLEQDPSDQRALINWGRVIGLRADAARQAGNLQDAAKLFDNAVDKFDGVLDLDGQNVQALRLGGMALLDAATCLAETDRKQAKQLVKDAEGYLESAVAADPSDMQSAQKLADCKAWLEYLRGPQYAS